MPGQNMCVARHKGGPKNFKTKNWKREVLGENYVVVVRIKKWRVAYYIRLGKSLENYKLANAMQIHKSIILCTDYIILI